MFKSLITNLKVLRCRYLYKRNQRIYRHQLPTVLMPGDTLRIVRDLGLSISRYGDGELSQLLGRSISFSKISDELRQRMIEVATVPVKNHLVCIPHYIRTVEGAKKRARIFWERSFAFETKLWLKFFTADHVYGAAHVSRFYMDYRTADNAVEIVDLWRQIWNGRDLLIVEGETTRLGVGNDLFVGAQSIKRILCPSKNAFDVYDKIMNAINDYYNGQLILIALGPTATVMAYDLAKQGKQAIDIGHIDVEYEWYIAGAETPIDIPSKAVNEVKGGYDARDVDSADYKSQIIARISL